MPEDMREIVQVMDFFDNKAKDPKHRVLGLGDDNLMYVWNWRIGDWCPYMDYRQAIKLGLHDPNDHGVIDVDD